MVAVVVSRLLLGLLAVPHAASTASLGVALTAVVGLLFLDESSSALVAIVVIVGAGALAFGVAQALTSSNTAPGDRTR
jgi:threonine/homoserine/homoserine lactone efflux protein